MTMQHIDSSYPTPSTGRVPQEAQEAALPRHVAVVGAAGGLGQGILQSCRENGIDFTAIVRSRPERITDLPEGSRVEVVTSLAETPALASALAGSEAVLTATGVTPTSQDESALLSKNMPSLEAAMVSAGVERIVIMSSLLTHSPGAAPSLATRIFSRFPGRMGRGARELWDQADALGRGALSSIPWTLVRGAVNAKGKDEPPVASRDWADGLNSWMPVSYQEMGRWMLQESSRRKFVRAAPLVSKRRSRRLNPL
ncbi:MAG: NAD(P)-binding oxidoreductase [Acidobacteriota bacterium]